MKKFLYICIASLLGLLAIYSCVKTPAVESAAASQEAYMSIEEARTFFEESFATAQTRTASENKKKFLDPGEYTPLWEDAEVSQNDALGSVDVTLLPQYKYRAIRSEFKNGKAKAYIVEMPQKLVIVKSKKTKAKAQYVLTLIPDKDYWEKNKNRNIIKRFLNSGDKDEFSGYALYTLNGFPARLNKYKKGEKIAGASIIGVTDKATITKRLKTILRELSKIKIQRKEQAVQTRSWGEDDYWGEDDWDALEDWANENDIEYNEYSTEEDLVDFFENNPTYIEEVEIWGSRPDADTGEDDNWPSCDCGCCWECGYCGVCDSCDPPEPEPCTCGNCAECGYGTPSLNSNNDDEINNESEDDTNGMIKEALDKVENNPLGKKLLDKVGTDRITFSETPHPKYGEGAKGVTNTSTGNITMYSADPKGTFMAEELFHRYQTEQKNKTGTDIHSGYKGNMEIEAKMFVLDYCEQNDPPIDPANKEHEKPFWDALREFENNPNDSTWIEVWVNFQTSYPYDKFPTTMDDYKKFKTDSYNSLNN